ncbi:RTJK polymerase, partial [Amia calva]|nr:RTJK polymerase [Amia calva]
MQKNIKRKKMLYSAYKRDGDETKYIEYVELQRDLKKGIRKAKREIERNIALGAKTNAKSFFQYYNSKWSIKEEVKQIKGKNGGILEKEQDVANVLNEYFTEVFTKEKTDDMPQVDNQSSQTLREIRINEGEVQKGLAELKTNKSPETDGIFPTVLKEMRDIIYRPLTQLFQMTLRTGDVPTAWKTANVIPIHKKGDKTEPGNYRPISLTCIIYCQKYRI